MAWDGRQLWGYVILLGAALLSACGSTSRRDSAPVEDRRPPVARPGVETSASLPAKPPLPGAENAGKPGYYTVKPGDTLIRISLDHGQNWREVARWNSIAQPNQIEVGQVLRIAPPDATVVEGSGVVTRPIGTGKVTTSPVTPGQSPTARPAAGASTASSPAAPTESAGESEPSWVWPVSANGPMLAGFDEVKNKGIDIGGKAGDPVLAAADGRVVYVGAGLRGYGNLIILKHDSTYLTAYAHNQTLLVKEDQSVQKGQKIAEMGSSDADRVKLHFEVRRQGKPVDPLKHLPSR